MQKVPLTVRGAQLLKDELQHLKSVERPAVIEAIAEARSHGDLSENAEYDAAKEKQGFVEGRIAELESKLSYAHIVNPAELDADGKIVFAATVTLEDCDSEENVTYQIVGDDARALIGKYEGDVAEVQAPGGVREYEIVAVQYI
ncbi:MAG TPA: transcription elongation factor GreA [Vitreoscilla sp.]|nr:transcription elongation factor GreA [Vitreoscilla sp.]